MIPALIDTAMAISQVNADVYDSALVTQKVLEASAIVMRHIKLAEFPDEWSDDLDASPVQYTVPFEIQAATLLVFGTLWQFREGSSPSSFREVDVLSPAVVGLLRAHRDPTLA